MEIFFLDLPSTDPCLNLALEEHIFRRMPRGSACFLLWQNDKTVVVGRHQNTLAEINEPYIRCHGVQVVRRLSGGGAVYHDLGNLNYTFLTDAPEGGRVDLSFFCQPVAGALEALGVPVRLSGRNDLTVDGRKFSGSAQYVREGRVLHHGTLLFESDLSAADEALRVDPEKTRAKGVPSVRSRVANLRPYLPEGISLARFKALLTERLFPGENIMPYTLTAGDLAAAEALRSSRYAAWAWNYGESPPCTLLRRRRVEGCGTVEAHIDLRDGRIAALTFRGDFFSTVEPEELAAGLVGLPLTEEALAPVLAGTDAGVYFTGLDSRALLDILCTG